LEGQVRFVRFMDQPNTINIENSEIGVPLEWSSCELYSQEGIQIIIENHQSKVKKSLHFNFSIYFC
jgi:hypothetical protein